MLEGLSDLTAPSVQIEGSEFTTTYSFEKMTALSGWKTLLTIRAEVGNVLKEEIAVAFSDRGRAAIASIISVILTLPTSFIVLLQDTMWQHTFFSNKHTGNQRQKIHKADDMAFDGQDPIVIGEVLARSLAVNFTSSFQRMKNWDLPPNDPSTSP